MGRGPVLLGLLGLLGLGCTPPTPERADAAKPPPKPAAPLVCKSGAGPKSFVAFEQLPTFDEVSARDHLGARKAPWRGVPLPHALDLACGTDWRDADELVFTCRDGYQPRLAVKTVLEAEPWLVWARADGATFALQQPGKPLLELGPFYVVWPQAEPADAQWPFQITAVEPVRQAEQLGAIMPAAAAAPAVQRGFDVWRAKCHKCHRLGGVGGKVGPELNRPVSVLDYWQPAMLRRWIRSPQSIREGSPMPPVALSDRALDDLLAYLRDRAPTPPSQGSP